MGRAAAAAVLLGLCVLMSLPGAAEAQPSPAPDPGGPEPEPEPEPEPAPEPEPEPEPEPALVVYGTATFAIAEIPVDAERVSFEQQFADSVADLHANVSSSNVTVLGITAGSIVVSFTVDLEDEAQADALSSSVDGGSITVLYRGGTVASAPMVASTVAPAPEPEPEPVPGCTDADAFNFEGEATDDDGSCIEKVLGCTDTLSFNHDPLANTNNATDEAFRCQRDPCLRRSLNGAHRAS